MNLLKTLVRRHDAPASARAAPPPKWTPAAGTSHADGLFHNASGKEYDDGMAFCAKHPPATLMLLPDDIAEHGCAAWGLAPPDPLSGRSHFIGHIGPSPRLAKLGDGKHAGMIQVETGADCRDACLLSTLPIAAGLYETAGREGVYFEITVHKMSTDGVIAIGTACAPYPAFRLPGWHRLSMALHLDDCRIFCEDSEGGKDYALDRSRIQPGAVIGCGLTFTPSQLFFTCNGERLPTAFSGVYNPCTAFDVFAAIGVCGATRFSVNFGAEAFAWEKSGDKSAWRVNGYFRRPAPLAGAQLPGGQGGQGPDGDDELPTYTQARRM